jgi:hypothetical protein
VADRAGGIDSQPQSAGSAGGTRPEADEDRQQDFCNRQESELKINLIVIKERTIDLLETQKSST